MREFNPNDGKQMPPMQALAFCGIVFAIIAIFMVIASLRTTGGQTVVLSSTPSILPSIVLILTTIGMMLAPFLDLIKRSNLKILSITISALIGFLFFNGAKFIAPKLYERGLFVHIDSFRYEMLRIKGSLVQRVETQHGPAGLRYIAIINPHNLSPAPGIDVSPEAYQFIVGASWKAGGQRNICLRVPVQVAGANERVALPVGRQITKEDIMPCPLEAP